MVPAACRAADVHDMDGLGELIGRGEYAVDARVVAEALIVHLGGMGPARSEMLMSAQSVEASVAEGNARSFDDVS